ncbi:alkaline phosphatase D family protein [Haloferula rosea]|uniref:Alkaline phosphatase D family protein n=1 Tax=Haloferula rosea TaxID=490093 RepID=A0A934R9Q9_9BACT|nr:alkaline phosphatase D family protein [Haloferula rosea]MBK1825793.1 alkaline phosphatase D family protein [Haloferula rosea]
MNPRQIPLLGVALASGALGTPIEIINPSGEINSGVDRQTVNHPLTPGWSGNDNSVQVINDGTDFGNGGWRLTFEDSDELFQMTSHTVETGAAYSLRFDASIFSGGSATGSFAPIETLIGGAVLNGNFNADTSPNDSRSFAQTPNWFNAAGPDQNGEATRTGPANTQPPDGSRNAVIAIGNNRFFGIDTGHTLSTGDTFRATYQWRDAFGWDDLSARIQVSIYTTSDDTSNGSPTILETIESSLSQVDSTYQTDEAVFSPVPASAAGKRLFVSFSGPLSGSGFARLDDFVLERGTLSGGRVLTADLYVDNGGSRQVVATRTYDFKSPTTGVWDHYHLAVQAGSLDAHVGKTLGVQFRSNPSASSNFQSVDNVRLDFWASSSPDGSFTDNWNSASDRPWAGPGYWANRLQDWQLASNRIEVIQGTRERRTLHRPGTSIRGNGEDFSLSVRTGLNTGTLGANSRSGFLIGGAPNVDWRGALLVSDGLGRDFGLFLGISGDGTLLIEDYSTGSLTALSSAGTTGFAQNTRLDLDAIYDDSSGSYQLILEAFDTSENSLGSTSTNVPSDRVLGAFGLLSHHGGSAATHWYDDFSGSGAALHPETDRHLAIVGAMHTLSKGTLKLTAQLSPVDVASTPPVALDVWNGSSWQQIATTPVDNTDNLSSYTATFSVTGWNDQVDQDYRIRVNVDGIDYSWQGTVRRDPVEKEEIVIASTTCQRITDGSLQNNGFDWTPVGMWQPHVQTYQNLSKHDPDVLLAHGDQIYEGQPTSPDKSSATNRQLDYLYKWNLWVLQVRDLTKDIPTIAIPDDHDIYQGNLWGEGGIATNNQNTGGYTEPASWVRMVERTQTSNLPDPDPYNPVQPAPDVAQGIKVYFTGLTYGRLGFAILEDRKFKTGGTNPPANPDDQFLLGDRQHAFLDEWNKDWGGQDVKLVVSQSPMANVRTHAGSGYNFFLNDKDTHGWPVHRRNEAWESWRTSRMFQLAGDQHLATLVQHGVQSPRDAGFSFTAPAIANFFPRAFDPVNNSNGTTTTVSPYAGDYFFDGVGTLPDGVTPNRSANDPHHFNILGAGNPPQYYGQSLGIDPVNLHDRGAGYAITRVRKSDRMITFECWPIHPDPDFPQTGGQFDDWPQTIRQTDNDGRVPTGYLTLVNSLWRNDPVVRVFDEADGSLVHAMRVRGNRYRPPVYDNSTTYRVEIAYDDETVSETRLGQTAAPFGPPAIHFFEALQPSIITGNQAILQWDVTAPSTLSIDQGVGDVVNLTVDGIGFLEVSPNANTTYTLTLNGGITADTTVLVFAGRAAWDAANFSAAELGDPEISGGDKDPDGDGFSNDEEFQFQADPRSAASTPQIEGTISESGGSLTVDFSSAYPLMPSAPQLLVETSTDLTSWAPVPSNSYEEIGRNNNPSDGTSQVVIRLDDSIQASPGRKFYRARWLLE